MGRPIQYSSDLSGLGLPRPTYRCHLAPNQQTMKMPKGKQIPEPWDSRNQIREWSFGPTLTYVLRSHKPNSSATEVKAAVPLKSSITKHLSSSTLHHSFRHRRENFPLATSRGRLGSGWSMTNFGSQQTRHPFGHFVPSPPKPHPTNAILLYAKQTGSPFHLLCSRAASSLSFLYPFLVF